MDAQMQEFVIQLMFFLFSYLNPAFFHNNIYLLQPQARNEKLTYEILACLYKDFSVYEHYNVDKYLSCCGLSVAEKYRGRGIGLKLLKTR